MQYSFYISIAVWKCFAFLNESSIASSKKAKLETRKFSENSISQKLAGLSQTFIFFMLIFEIFQVQNILLPVGLREFSPAIKNIYDESGQKKHDAHKCLRHITAMSEFEWKLFFMQAEKIRRSFFTAVSSWNINIKAHQQHRKPHECTKNIFIISLGFCSRKNEFYHNDLLLVSLSPHLSRKNCYF